MKHKRLKSVFVAAAICITQCSVFAQGVPEDIAGTEYESDYRILSGLSIMEEGDDTNFKPYSNITRGEFAKIAAPLLGENTISGGSPFEDTKDNSELDNAVSILYNYGVISLNHEKSFDPERNIKGSEAVKILMNILGYNILAEQKGGYPNGYMMIANETHLIKNISISADEQLTYGAAARLIVNALDISVAKINTVESSGNAVISLNGEKLMYEKLGIEKLSGVMNANHTFSIDQKSVCSGENEVRIGEDVFLVSDKSLSALAGRYVDCYYKFDEATGNKNAKMIVESPDMNSVITVDAENVKNVNGLDVSYFRASDSRESQLKLSQSVAVIKNGQNVESVNSGTFTFGMGYITFIDNDGKGGYDVALINSYKNMLVSNVTDKFIYSEFDGMDNIDLKEKAYESFEIYNADGIIIDVQEIKEGDVLSVFKSENNKYIRAVRQNEVINGVIEGIKRSSGKTDVKINGIFYRISDDFETKQTLKLDTGLEGGFLLDAYGKIFSVTNGKAGKDLFGFIVKAGKMGKGFNEKNKIKLLEEDGRLYVRELADNVKIDGKQYTTDSQILTTAQNAVEKPALFRLNSKEEVYFIDTPDASENNEDDTLNTIISDLTVRYKTGTQVFEGRMAIDKNTRVFVVPKAIDSAKDNEFGAATTQYFSNDVSYNGISGYRLGDGVVADCMVVRDSFSRNDGHVFIIRDVETVLEDGESVTKLTLTDGSSENTYIASSSDVTERLYKITAANYANGRPTATELITDSISVTEGDIVMLEFDADDKVSALDVVYSAENKTLYSINPNTSDYHADCYRYIYADVSKIQGSIVEIPIGAGGTTKHYYNVKNCRVFTYDSTLRENSRFSEGSYKDIREGSKCVFISKGGSPQTVVIYK